MTASDVFHQITAALDKASVPYMLVGSLASTYYGAPRTTQDVDIVIAPTPENLQAFLKLLPSDRYYFDVQTAIQALRTSSMFNLLDSATGWKIDFIIRKGRAFSDQEFRRRRRVEVDGVVLFAATAEDVVISKLEWAKAGGSARQIDDVGSILRLQWHALDRGYIAAWVRELGLSQQWEQARQVAGIVGA